MLCRYFWLSDKNKINQNKSSSTSLPTINHHQPTSSSWSSLWSWSLQTLLFTDVDECSDKIHVCDVNAKCTNTNGSHNCTCTDGYIGDGKSCQGTLITILITAWVHNTCSIMNWMIARQSYPSFITLDIDECSNGSHVCDVNANCTKTGGSYNCTWKKGYTGDGRRCQGTCCNFYYHLWMYFV